MRQPHRIAELALQQIANDCGLVLPELAAFDRKVETGFLEGQSISSIWMRPSCTGSTELAISISLRARGLFWVISLINWGHVRSTASEGGRVKSSDRRPR
jgi:hypothetical protein